MLTPVPRTPRQPLTAAQQDLTVRYLPLARSLARPLKLGWPHEAAEFESAALFALVEAAQSYKPKRNVKFATFARYRIWGALRDVQRKMIAKGWKGAPDGAPAVESLCLAHEEDGHVITDPAPPVGAEIESREHLEAALRKLPDRHAQVCRTMYLEGKSQGEAAAVIGCSNSHASYLHTEALAFLKERWTFENRRNHTC